ncbi:hypothetical protein M405DRAFT_932669, partial [Rhizopogon salebrosus TDB-379]
MPQRAENAKSSMYVQRKLVSIPAPLDLDSDPEFNPGTFVYEPKKRSKRKSKAGGESSPSSPRKRRSDVLGKFESISRSRKRRPMDPDAARQHNPLKEFFDDDLGLQSASDDEVDDENPEDGDSAEERESEPEQPIILKTMVAFMRESKESIPLAQPGHAKAPVDEDSATEPESEPEVAHRSAKRKSPASEQVLPPSKRIKTPCPVDDSETEPESDEESQMTLKTPYQPNISQMEASDSETEPEDEDEMGSNSTFNPRPGFPLAPGQTALGPMILDKHKGIMVPGSINTYLREYQREGVLFFWERYNKGHGGLLGDDMGLGKTIQVISFLSAIMKKHGDERDIDRRRNHVSNLQDGPQWRKRRTLPPANKTWPTCLIIAPTSVVPNWEREFETWGYFEVGSYTGSKKEREDVLTDFKMGRLDVVLTTFEVARRDIALLDDLAWSAVFIDEAHRVKNPKSKITVAFNQFTCLRRFGLTGTTIQNSYMEAWTILDWTNPGRLGTSKQWKGYVVKPLTIGQSASATEEERTKALTVAITVRDKVLPRYFKRRTKDIIKHQLPIKTDEVVFCPLTPVQIAVYRRILDMNPVQNLVNKDQLCDCGSENKRKDCCHPIEKGGVLKYMSILIKISNHLALILP